MNRLIKFYNQNRYLVWIVVLTLIAIIALIQILNNFVSKENSIKEAMNQNTTESTTINKNYSVITGQEVKDEASQIIDQFMDYCNNQKVELAYELLSSECKEVLYPTLEDFIKNYYSKIFSEKKTYLYQAWITNSGSYTYKVDFVEDMLATGTASKTSITDYYTVVKNNDKYELNINKFVGITNINKTDVEKDFIIKINRKRIYMDYETYELEVENNSKEEIMLDNLQTTKTVYLESDNEQKYYWYSHEILEDDILVREGQRKKIEIKFNKEYQPNNKTIKVVFSNIIINKNDILEIEVVF